MVKWDESKAKECVVTGIQITKEKKNQFEYEGNGEGLLYVVVAWSVCVMEYWVC